MKKLTLSILALSLTTAGIARADFSANFAMELALKTAKSPASQFNLINWQIGDFQDVDLTMSGMALGSMHKEATSNEGNGVWLTETTSGGMIGSHTVEVLLDRSNGKILKMKQDGKDQTPPAAGDEEVTGQERATITVPAGTFDTVHLTISSKTNGNAEIWANPKLISLDGTAQMTTTSNGMPIEMQLTKFGTGSN